MKKFNTFTQKLAMAIFAAFFGFLATAQDKAADLKVDVDVNKGMDTGNWMSNPLYWVIGALVLIVLIALVARGGGNK